MFLRSETSRGVNISVFSYCNAVYCYRQDCHNIHWGGVAPIIMCVGFYLGGGVEPHKALPLWGYFEPPAAEFLH